MAVVNEELEVSQEVLSWADIKDSHKTGKVLNAQAIGIEIINFGENQKEECLKLNYNGTYGYLPKRFIDNYDFKGLQYFLGKYFDFVVEHVDIDSHLFVANRIKALEMQAKKFWKQAKEGQIYSAFVRGVDPYRLYLLVEGVPVTMPRTEYSYSYVEDLREEVEIGETIDVKLLKVVKPGQRYTRKNAQGEEEEVVSENGLIQVSSRVLEKDPWTNIHNYKEKSYYLGTITKVHMDYGLFIELEPGLVVRTNFPPSSRGELFKKGQQVNVKINEIDYENRRIKAIVIVLNKKNGKVRVR